MTAIGQPVQIFLPMEGVGNQITAGIISALDGGTNTEIRVFPVDGSQSYVLKNVKHLDFMVKGEPFWRDIETSNYWNLCKKRVDLGKTTLEKTTHNLSEKIKTLQLDKLLWKAICCGCFLFIVFLAILSECERRNNVVNNGKIIKLEYKVDSLNFVIQCKDTFILEQTYWNSLKTDRERKKEIRKDKIERLGKGFFD